MYFAFKDYFANDKITKTIAKFNSHNKRIALDKIKQRIKPFLNFEFINGVPVFIFNDKWTLNGAQAPKIIETIIDIAAKD